MMPFMPRFIWGVRFLVLAGGCLISGGGLLGSPAAAKTLLVENGQDAVPIGEEITVYVKVSLRPPAPPKEKARTPLNIALVLDRSGSMNGERLVSAKRAANRLIELAGPEDRVSMVTFSDSAEVLLPPAQEINKEKAAAAINRLKANGFTALYAGVSLGGKQVLSGLDTKRVNRVVLLSDGEANIGPSSPEEVAALGQTLARQGLSITTVGLGLEYNETLMARLAGASDGNHVFVKSPADLETIFQKEFMDAAAVVARDGAIEVICEEGVTPIRIYGYEGTISGGRVTITMPQLQGEQEKYAIIEAKAKTRADPGAQIVAKVSAQYTLMSDGKTVIENTESVVRVVNDKEDVLKSHNIPVMENVIFQTAVEANDKALEAMNAGKREEAQGLLKATEKLLGDKSVEYGSKKLEALQKQTGEYEAVTENQAPVPSSTQKSMKENLYNQKNQKGYK